MNQNAIQQGHLPMAKPIPAALARRPFRWFHLVPHRMSSQPGIESQSAAPRVALRPRSASSRRDAPPSASSGTSNGETPPSPPSAHDAYTPGTPKRAGGRISVVQKDP